MIERSFTLYNAISETMNGVIRIEGDQLTITGPDGDVELTLDLPLLGHLDKPRNDPPAQSTEDAELEAVRTVLQIMRGLDHLERVRALQYVCKRFGIQG